ncbi:hypothetical protein HY212_06435 [Candidatus Pacearchaeota archaeon]|nr:hypothetical protein [Candidatus Pacearchaeota archaeon]
MDLVTDLYAVLKGAHVVKMSKLKLLCIIFVLSIFILIQYVNAEDCKTDEVKSVLKKALINYLNDPQSSKLDLLEIKDLLNLYVSVGERDYVFCDFESSITKKRFIDTLKKIKNVVGDISDPTCSDGTLYESCSISKPAYCLAGKLISKCSECGCSNEVEICQNELCTFPVEIKENDTTEPNVNETNIYNNNNNTIEKIPDQNNSIDNSTGKLCEDSDGGKNYSVKGSIKLNGVDIVSDSCENAINATVLNEFFCDETNTLGYSSVSYACPYRCSEGKCNEAPGCVGSACENTTCGPVWDPVAFKWIINTWCEGNTSYCYDSDGKQNYDKKGYATLITPTGRKQVFYDYCSSTISTGSQAWDYWCVTNEGPRIDYGWTMGTPKQCNCVDGACVGYNGCYDADGGVNISYRAYVFSDRNLGGLRDECQNTSVLIEYICTSDGTTDSSVLINCKNGCSNGVCV